VALPLVVGLPARADDSAASEEIRRALARELHDRVAQTLTTMLIELENYKAEQAGRESVLRQMDALQKSTREVLSSLREVLYDLRNDTLGIGESFQDAVRDLTLRFEERSGIKTELIVSDEWPSRVKSPAAINLYRIIEEGLSNVRQHSGATRVKIVLTAGSRNAFVLNLSDNGRGVELVPSPQLGMGMLGMRERSLFLGADLTIVGSPGQGTVLTIVIPRKALTTHQ
jgi:NarL family two-component system sensor histidine kinase LiaS